MVNYIILLFTIGANSTPERQGCTIWRQGKSPWTDCNEMDRL